MEYGRFYCLFVVVFRVFVVVVAVVFFFSCFFFAYRHILCHMMMHFSA